MESFKYDNEKCKNEWYWYEASGSIEHLCDKYFPCKIPVKYVKLFMNNIEEVDEYHYKKQFKNRTVQKCVFGYNSKDVLDKIEEEIAKKVTDGIKTVNGDFMIDETHAIDLDMFKNKTEDERCKGIIDVFYHLYDDYGITTFKREHLDLLRECVRKLKSFTHKSNKNIRNYKIACSRGNVILNDCCEFRMKKLML